MPTQPTDGAAEQQQQQQPDADDEGDWDCEDLVEPATDPEYSDPEPVDCMPFTSNGNRRRAVRQAKPENWQKAQSMNLTDAKGKKICLNYFLTGSCQRKGSRVATLIIHQLISKQ